MFSSVVESKVSFPEALEFLFERAPYKIGYGGRGAAKSWGYARALLIEAAKRKLRILCARETMKSIRDSVHQLLEEQIKALKLDDFYRVEKSAIYGVNGSEILFAGLKHNIDNIKSMEAIDICWVEEAQVVSKVSWDKLIPTLFRVPNCELWVSFNPDLEGDNTYQRFVVNPPAGAIVRKLTWRDNPWFPEGLRRELEQAKRNNIDEYNHIWEGTCINTLANAIYANELRLVDTEGRIRRVPYDPSKPVDTAWDLGFGDMVCIWMFQSFPMEYRLIDYEEGCRHPLHYYISELQKRGYIWGTDYLPWDGGLKAMGSGKSIEELMRAAGRRVRVAPRLPVTDGINAARTIFPLCYFDEQRCAAGLRSLRCYRYGEMQSYEGPTREPLHDIHCLVPDTLVLTRYGTRRIMDLQGEEVLTPCGWSTYRGPWITQRNAPLVEVGFADGSTVKCTPEHLFLTESGWRSAESLTPATLIQSCLIPLSSISTGGCIDAGPAKCTISDPLIVRWGQSPKVLAGQDLSIERFGRVLSARFQKAVKSIIGTMSLPITALPIWNACLAGNIDRKPGAEFTRTASSLIKPERPQQNGIDLKQAGSGIGDMPQKASSGENGNVSLKTALIVVLNSLRSFGVSIRRGFARRHANQLAVTGVRSLTERADVCCIEVPDIHCFALANGAIVHNSHAADSFRTMAVSIRQPQKDRERQEQQQRQYASPWS